MFMKIKHLALALVAMTVAAGLVSCGEKKKEAKSATVVCDNSFKDIMEQEIDLFEYNYPGNFILCNYVPQAVAIDSLMSGNTRTAIIGRDLTKGEKAQLRKQFSSVRSMQLAVDAVALIVNPANPVDAVSLEELGSIMRGEVKSWYDLDPTGEKRNIQVAFDDEGSSLAIFMRDNVVKGNKFGDNVRSVGSVDSVINFVQERPGAIGVVGVSWLTRDLEMRDTMSIDERVERLRAEETFDGNILNQNMDKQTGIKVLGVMRNDSPIPYKPYQQFIYDGKYPLTREIWIVSTQGTVGAANKFYTYVTSPEGQRILTHTGVMPARMKTVVYEVSN